MRIDGARQWRARNIILATGVVDRLPQLDRVEEAISTGALRLCAVCDGYEARDDAIAVLGRAADAVAHVEFLRTFSRNVTVITTDEASADSALQQRAIAAGVTFRYGPARWSLRGSKCEARFRDGSLQRFDTLYPVLGATVLSGLGSALGARTDEESALIVDDHMETSVPDLFAIGDVVSALNQISFAVDHATIAATAVHGRLPRNPC